MALMTPKDVASELGVSESQVRALTDSGALPFINIGLDGRRPTRRYDPADVAAFMETRRGKNCRSTSAPAPAPIRTTSAWEAVDLVAILERRKNEKLAKKKRA